MPFVRGFICRPSDSALWEEDATAKFIVPDWGDIDDSGILHCKDKIPKFRNKFFPEKEYRGLSPNFYIHASVSDLYTRIPMIGLPILLEEICRPILGLYKSLSDT